MSNKPRPSLLDLFDPLLANALSTPIPESPPCTPSNLNSSYGTDTHRKENESIVANELTMSVFFGRISKPQIFPSLSLNDPTTLIDIEAFSPRLVRSADDFDVSTAPSCSTSSSETNLLKKSVSIEPISLSGSMKFQDSSSSLNLQLLVENESKLPLPKAMSVLEDLGSVQERHATSSSPNTVEQVYHRRRRSSIDISDALSSKPILIPDSSFDLLNGDISFLSKVSEDGDDSRIPHPCMHKDLQDAVINEEISSGPEGFETQGQVPFHTAHSLSHNNNGNGNPDTPKRCPSDSSRRTPCVIQKDVRLPERVKKTKVFTSHRKAPSADLTVATSNTSKRERAVETNPRASNMTLPAAKGGARRILINGDTAPKGVVPTQQVVSDKNSAKQRIPSTLHSGVVPFRTHLKSIQPISNVGSKMHVAIPSNTRSAANSVGTRQAPSRLPAPVQARSKGIGTGASVGVKARSNGLVKPIRSKPLDRPI